MIKNDTAYTIISKWSEYDGDTAYIKVPTEYGLITINMTDEQMLVGPPTTSIWIRTHPEPKMPNAITALVKLLPQYTFTLSSIFSMAYGDMIDVRVKEHYLCSIAISEGTLIPIHIRHIDEGTDLRPMSLANPELVNNLNAFLLKIAKRKT